MVETQSTKVQYQTAIGAVGSKSARNVRSNNADKRHPNKMVLVGAGCTEQKPLRYTGFVDMRLCHHQTINVSSWVYWLFPIYISM